MINRDEAFMILGINANSSADEIKKRYKMLCKKYHPDQNKDSYAENYYVQVQEAYRYLREHPYPERWLNQGSQIYGNYSGRPVNGYSGMQYGYANRNQWGTQQYQMNVRPAKIFSTDKNAEKLHRRQISYAEDKKKIENMLKEKATETTESSLPTQQQEEKAMKAIQAIWLAEQIHRRMEQDRIQREKEQKRNLYRAFSQHHILAEEEKGDMSE